MPTAYNIWPGSGSFFPGDTPYGFYDEDLEFQCDIEKASDWAAKRLGYLVQDVELNVKHFFAAYEEAVNEFGYYVNLYAARDAIPTLLGIPTGSLQLQQTYVPNRTNGLIQIAEDYGTAAGVGGTLRHYSASIDIKQGQQTYDLRSLATSSLSLESGSFDKNTRFKIRRVFHELDPAVGRYFVPWASSGMMSDRMLDDFTWGAYSPGASFVLSPAYWDALRIQAIEFNDMIRKSAYTFALTGDRIRLFPIPREDFKLWFHYTLEDEITGDLDGGHGKISDISNVPYFNVTYQYINDIGKNWIRNYFLAICKELLGRIRGKYSSLPIPGNEISLNWSDLISEAQSEKEALRVELKEYLESFTQEKQLERKAAEAQNLQGYLKYVPMRIYVG